MYPFIYLNTLGLVTRSCPTLATPWTVAPQAPLPMGFSRQEYWSGLPFPSPNTLKSTHPTSLLITQSLSLFIQPSHFICIIHQVSPSIYSTIFHLFHHLSIYSSNPFTNPICPISPPTLPSGSQSPSFYSSHLRNHHHLHVVAHPSVHPSQMPPQPI